MLQALVANAVWRDASGREQGGALVNYTMPGNPPIPVTLGAVFDDQPEPPGGRLPAGSFLPGSGPQGTLTLYVQRLAAEPDITPLLFHESLHIIAWLLRRNPRAPGIGNTPRTRPWMTGLDVTRDEHRSELGWIRLNLLELADHVDRLRRTSSAPPVDRSVLDLNGLPRYLLEEIQARTETLIFEELASIDAGGPARAGRAILGERFLLDYIFRFYFSHLRNRPNAFRPDDLRLVNADSAATNLLTSFAALVDNRLAQRAAVRTAGRERIPAQRQNDNYQRPQFPSPLPPLNTVPRGGSVFDRPGGRAPSSPNRPRPEPSRRQPAPSDAGTQPGSSPQPGGITHVVDFVVVQGSDRNPYADLAFANRVYADCGVSLMAGSLETIAAAQALRFLGFADMMHVQSDDCPITSVSRDLERLFNFAQTAFHLSARLRAFYVPHYDHDSNGFSFFPECSSGAVGRFNGNLVIQNSARDRTLAHELGHILLNSGLHAGYVDSGDTDNLMVDSPNATDSLLDRAQCGVLNGSTQT